MIIKDDTWLIGFMIVHWPEFMKLMITAIMRIMDAVAWIKKYLEAASVERGLALLIKIGIIDRRLISSPTQIMSQWELISVIRVPKNSVK